MNNSINNGDKKVTVIKKIIVTGKTVTGKQKWTKYKTIISVSQKTRYNFRILPDTIEKNVHQQACPPKIQLRPKTETDITVTDRKITVTGWHHMTGTKHKQ